MTVRELMLDIKLKKLIMEQEKTAVDPAFVGVKMTKSRYGLRPASMTHSQYNRPDKREQTEFSNGLQSDSIFKSKITSKSGYVSDAKMVKAGVAQYNPKNGSSITPKMEHKI